jgi:hypothetical protein
MNTKIILLATIGMLVFVALSCFLSESSWSSKENTSNSYLEVTGLSSLATGNLNPSARNPGLEIFCTSLYDFPGGYCSYFAPGVPPDNFRVNVTIAVSGP